MSVSNKLEDIVRRHVRNSQNTRIDIDAITADMMLSDLGIDSLGFIELINEIESEFNMTVPNEALDKLKTVGNVLELLQGADAE